MNGRAVKDWRERMEWSQRRLAQELEYSVRQVIRIEQQAEIPRVIELALARLASTQQ